MSEERARPEANTGGRGRIGRRIGRFLDTTLPVYASAVFVGLWFFVALAVFTDSSLPADTWAWLQGLDTLPAIIVWLAILPLGVFLWAWQAHLEPLFMGFIMVALVGWTFIAWSGSRRAFRRLSRSRSSG